MQITKNGIRAALCVMAVAGVLASQEAGAQVRPGQTMPGFALKDENGKTVKLPVGKGHPVVLVFYASWCKPCNAEASYVEKDVWQAYKGRGVQVLGLAEQEKGANPLAKLREFRALHKVTYPLLLDENVDVFSQFGAGGIPSCVVLDGQGRFVARTGSLEDVKKHLQKLTTKTKPARHTS